MVGKTTDHGQIGDAIAIYGAKGEKRFTGMTAFSFWYGGWSIGDVSLSQMCADAPQLANRLEILSASPRAASIQSEINRNCVETTHRLLLGTIRVMFNTVLERTES